MKSTLLLAAAFFMISAPAPDANDIAELTANFIVPEQLPGLGATEVSPRVLNNSNASVRTQKMRGSSKNNQNLVEGGSLSSEESVRSNKNKTYNQPANGG